MPPAGTLQRVLGALAGEAVSISNELEDKVCIVARRDTWSRGARRRARALDSDLTAGGMGTGEEEVQRPVLLVAHVWVEGGCAGESEVQLVVQWKRGQDVQAFESFGSHVGRKIGEV
jgi:hypothetical protein